MAGDERFSVYNVVPPPSWQGHPLERLLPESREFGFHAQRNLLKPLNHLSFLRRKEAVAEAVNLHNVRTPPAVFDQNLALLQRHQRGEISVQAVILELAAQRRGLTPHGISELLREYATVSHMEFHPSDRCNLECTDCTYGHDDPGRRPQPTQFPIEKLSAIRALRPRSMVIIGGGEPTLYRSGHAGFQELVEQVASASPGIALALVTNGTFKPPGAWPNRFSWIRVSIDAATPETYRRFRGKAMFQKALANYLAYLDHDVPSVGVSFLFARSNIHEYAEFARLIYESVVREKPHHLHKVSISYRPLRRDPYRYSDQFDEAISADQIESTIRSVAHLADVSPEMERFLRDQTNVTAFLGGNTHPPHEFERCYYSQTFRIVRASGDLRPCFIRVFEPEFLLGNIVTDAPESIALNTLLVAARRSRHCDPYGCRQCHVNNTFERGLNGSLLPSQSPAVANDPMY